MARDDAHVQVMFSRTNAILRLIIGVGHYTSLDPPPNEMLQHSCSLHHVRITWIFFSWVSKPSV